MNTVRHFLLCALLTCTSLAFSVCSFAQASLEVPQADSFQSGTGLIAGWSCTGPVTVEIDGVVTETAYGTSRTDAASACGGNAAVGFGVLVSYNLYGAGEHFAQLVVAGKKVGNPVKFTVVVPAGNSVPYLQGVSKTVTVSDFPVNGKTTTLAWQEAQQNFVITAVTGQGNGTVFPTTFKGIDLLSLDFMRNYGACQATVTLKNTTAVAHTVFLYFNVLVDGVSIGKIPLPAYAVEAGATAEAKNYVVIGETRPACGTFELQLDSAMSSVL